METAVKGENNTNKSKYFELRTVSELKSRIKSDVSPYTDCNHSGYSNRFMLFNCRCNSKLSFDGSGEERLIIINDVSHSIFRRELCNGSGKIYVLVFRFR